MAPEHIVARVFGVSSGSIDDSTSNLSLQEWDSFGHMTLIFELEAAYGIELSPEDAMKVTSISAIKGLLRDRGVGW